MRLDRVGPRYSRAYFILLLTSLSTITWGDLANAQIVRSGSLGPSVGAPGIVEPIGPHFRIDSTLGEIKGTNLFHGFLEFNVQGGESATFTNSQPVAIGNIFSRVEGNHPSTINGLLASEIPGASLYLINPRGVLFGPTAALDIGATIGMPGSFFASTADYVRLGTTGEPNAGFFSTHVQVSDLLTSAPPTAFGFLTPSPVAITFEGSRLPGDPLNPTIHPETGNPIPIPVGQTFAAIGGDITVRPDPSTGTPVSLFVPGGQIDLVSVASPGEVRYPTLADAPNVNGESFGAEGTIRMSGSPGIPGTLDVSDYLFEGNGAAGAIRLKGGAFEADNASLMALTIADVAGANPGIWVNMAGDLVLKNSSVILTENFGPGGSGSITLSGRRVNIESGSLVRTDSLDGGLGFIDPLGTTGNITVIGTESITVTGTGQFNDRSTINAQATGPTGDTGSINLSAPTITVANRGLVQQLVTSNGRTGDIITTENVRELSVLDGGGIEMVHGATNGVTGKLNIATQESVTVSGQFDPATPSRIAYLRDSGGSAAQVGVLSIETGQFSLTDGAELVGVGDRLAGINVSVTARESVTLAGNSLMTVSDASSGSFTIRAPVIELDHATVRGRHTSNLRDAGPTILEATAGNLTLANGSLVRTSIRGDAADAGPLSLVASDSILFSGGSSAESSSVEGASGNGGPVTVRAGNLVSLSGANTGIFSIADETSTGNGGSVTVQANIVQVSDLATISATSSGTGNAGNVTVKGLASPAQAVLIDGAGSGIFTSTQGAGAGGTIRVETNTLTMQNGGTLSAATSGTTASAIGGDIQLAIPQSLTMANGALITTTSSGPANAGAIIMEDPRPANISMTNSSIIANATAAGTQASGGNITLLATDTIRLLNSQINTSVTGDANTVGGTIFIDPRFVILQNSQIAANAVQGQGGNITIIAGTFLKDPSSSVSASSQLGINGTVDIRATVQNLSGALVPLPGDLLAGTALVAQRCAARLAEGQISSFVLAGREGLPAEPDGHLGSPLEPRSTGSSGSVASFDGNEVAPSPSPLPLRGGEDMEGKGDSLAFSSLRGGGDVVLFSSLPRGEGVGGKEGTLFSPSPLRGEGGVRGGPVLLAAGPGFGPRLFESPIRAEDFMGACRR